MKKINTKIKAKNRINVIKQCFIMFTLVVLSVKTVYAIDVSLKITQEAASIIGSLKIQDDFKSPIGDYEYRAMKYNDKTIEFYHLSHTFVNAMIDDRIQVNKNGEFDGQCVSFVKSLTLYHKKTDTWIKGAQVTANSGIQVGTAIATFSKNGGTKYDATGSGSHTGILLTATSTYILILDQNWSEGDISGDSGTTGIHRIYFTGKGGVFDASAYYVINKY